MRARLALVAAMLAVSGCNDSSNMEQTGRAVVAGPPPWSFFSPSGDQTDAISTATLRTHAPISVTWNLKDAAGATVPDGRTTHPSWTSWSTSSRSSVG